MNNYYSTMVGYYSQVQFWEHSRRTHGTTWSMWSTPPSLPPSLASCMYNICRLFAASWSFSVFFHGRMETSPSVYFPDSATDVSSSHSAWTGTFLAACPRLVRSQKLPQTVHNRLYLFMYEGIKHRYGTPLKLVHLYSRIVAIVL